MCQIFVSDSKLGNCDDGSAYIRALVNIQTSMFVGSWIFWHISREAHIIQTWKFWIKQMFI